jgi:hypothetical protein
LTHKLFFYKVPFYYKIFTLKTVLNLGIIFRQDKLKKHAENKMDNKNDIYCFIVHIHLIRDHFSCCWQETSNFAVSKPTSHPISQQKWQSEIAISRTHGCILCHIFTISISKQYSYFSYKVNIQVSKTDWMPPQQIQTIQNVQFPVMHMEWWKCEDMTLHIKARVDIF